MRAEPAVPFPEVGPHTYLDLEKRVGRELLSRRLDLQIHHSADWYGGLGADRFHPENIDWLPVLVRTVLRLCGQDERGRRNALDLRCRHREVLLDDLPEPFEGFTVLHLTDLHIDGFVDGGARLAEAVSRLEVDLCVMTGDFRFLTWGEYLPALQGMSRLVPRIRARHGILGILGNHDPIEIVIGLEHLGIRMLLNESVVFERKGRFLAVGGVDDPHFYGCHEHGAGFFADSRRGLPDPPLPQSRGLSSGGGFRDLLFPGRAYPRRADLPSRPDSGHLPCARGARLHFGPVAVS